MPSDPRLASLRSGLLRALGWRGILLVAVAAALLAAVLLAVFGLFLLLLPLFLLAGLVGRLLWGRRKSPVVVVSGARFGRGATSQDREAGPVAIIDAKYEVIRETPPRPGRGWGP